jgi:phage tail-like protein
MPFPPELTLEKDLLGFRFGVFFFVGGVLPNPLDIRFRRVSGLSMTVQTEEMNEGGQGIYTQRLPTSIQHENLVLERGLVVGSPLNVDLAKTMTAFKFTTSNVLVTLFDEGSAPVAAWLLLKAYPVKWSTSNLDADEKELVIDTLELTYGRIQVLRI